MPSPDDLIRLAKREFRLSDTDRDARIGPEPLSAVLPALAAVGAIASIAAINWVANASDAPAPANRRRAAAAIRDLEKVCTGLEDTFARLSRFFAMYVGERGGMSTPLKFGVYGLKLPQASFPMFQALLSDATGALADANQTSFELMCLIEDGALEPPEDFYFALGEVQETLSVLIRERSTLQETLDEGLALSRRLTGLVRELKAHRTI